MKKLSQAVGAALLSLGFTATAGDEVVELLPLNPAPDAVDQAVEDASDAWFIELSSAPLAEGGNAAALRNEKSAFRSAARAAGVRYTERYAYDNLFNGFSVKATAAEVNRLARLPGVAAIYPVETYRMPEAEVSVPDMFTAISMTGANIARDELGLDGAGIKVAIMDTGIDIDHPDFGGNGTPGGTAFPNSKIVAGYDFVGDAFGTPGATPTPDNRPDDCGGHGTHVAGIVAADGRVKGVAPKAQLGAYRVFGCSGSTTADIMIAAMERAEQDGMQVLNMSIGASGQWPQYPTAKAATRLVNKGVVVIASAGNSGTSGLFFTGAPSVGEKVIGVASFDNTHSAMPSFTISPDNTVIAYGAATGAPTPPTSGSQPMARTGTATSAADACNPLPAGSLAGKVALIRRGTCGFYNKAINAQNAGASGVVLYNNVAGRISPTVAPPDSSSPAVTIPVVAVSDVEGVLINNRLATGPVSMTWRSEMAALPIATGGLVSSFSSWGTSYDLQLKPDIGGPGGSIYATYPLEAGGYASLSGTSMSAPHVAGTVALLLQAKPNTPAQAVRTILQNNALPKNWSGNPGLGLLEPTHRQGAGMVRIDRAILATTRVEPGKLSLGESEAGPALHTLTVKNSSDRAVTYTLSHVGAVATGPNLFTLSYFNAPAQVSFSAPTLTVPAGGTGTVDVTIAASASASFPQGGIYGGYVVLTPDDDSGAIRVPYTGYKGDYQARPVLTPTANGFPWLARLSGGSYVKKASGDVFTMADAENMPYFLVHLDNGARRLRMEVEDAVSGRSWHRAMDLEHVGRNSSASSFFGYVWDGVTTTANGKRSQVVPNGQYRVKLSVLKALGDENNPAHWETWTSPVITIARP